MARDDYKWRWSHVDEGEHGDRYVALLNRARADDDPTHFPTTLAWIDAQLGERVLEVGCGNGAMARAIARAVPAIREVVAVDASGIMIAEARRLLAGRDLPVHFEVADAHHLPFPDAFRRGPRVQRCGRPAADWVVQRDWVACRRRPGRGRQRERFTPMGDAARRMAGGCPMGQRPHARGGGSTPRRHPVPATKGPLLCVHRQFPHHGNQARRCAARNERVEMETGQ